MIVFHEQVIRALAALAGYTETYADHIRRHLDHEEMLPGFRADFLERATARGVDREAAEKIWHAVTQFASFGFCKAHAAAFAVPTYQSAWLKTHYPAHLVAGLLTHDPGMYPRRLILEDARQPRHPDPAARCQRERARLRGGGSRTGIRGARGASDSERSPRWGVRLALQDVHGISDAEIRSIMTARAERAFRDVGDFMRRTTVSRPVTEALAHAGAFDALGACPPPPPLRCDDRRARARGRSAHAHDGRRPAPKGTGSRTTPTPRWCAPSSR